MAHPSRARSHDADTKALLFGRTKIGDAYLSAKMEVEA